MSVYRGEVSNYVNTNLPLGKLGCVDNVLYNSYVARLVRAILAIFRYREQAAVRRRCRGFEKMNCQHNLVFVKMNCESSQQPYPI
jgi:hypothetical protein